MDSDGSGDEDWTTWFSSWSEIVSGSPGYTLVAGMFCGMLANVILRARPGPGPAAGQVMNMASAMAHGGCKMVLVVRTDIGMGKGKAAAQCAHAAVKCYKKALKDAPEMIQRWEGAGVTKVCVKVDSEDALLTIASQARDAGVVFDVVRDAGRTQIPTGTITVLGLGPAPLDIVHKITGHLKLYWH